MLATDTKVDSSFLISYKDDLDDVFQTYIKVINPFIVQFEILKNEFPIELQNEIRAIYGHLARAATADNPETVKRNIDKIKSHTKRALLDCYKYSCIIFTDNYNAFFERYKGVDLSYLNEGKFLFEVEAIYAEAKALYFDAKTAETSNISEEEHFELYECAYNKFVKLEEMLRNAEKSAEFLKHKATQKDNLAKASFWVGIIGIIVGIIGAIIGVL